MFVTSERTQVVEEFTELARFIEKAGVIVEEELGAVLDREGDLSDGSGIELFPERARKAALTDTVRLRLSEDRALWVEG